MQGALLLRREVVDCWEEVYLAVYKLEATKPPFAFFLTDIFRDFDFGYFCKLLVAMSIFQSNLLQAQFNRFVKSRMIFVDLQYPYFQSFKTHGNFEN
jgi:hypothetical protein